MSMNISTFQVHDPELDKLCQHAQAVDDGEAGEADRLEDLPSVGPQTSVGVGGIVQAEED